MQSKHHCHIYNFFLCAGSSLPCPHLRSRGDRDLQDLFRVLECTGIRFVPWEPIPFKHTTSDWYFTVSDNPSQETNVPLSIVQSKLNTALCLVLDMSMHKCGVLSDHSGSTDQPLKSFFSVSETANSLATSPR